VADTIVVNEVVDTIVIAVGGEQGPPGITDFNPTLSFVGDVTGSGTTGQAVTTSLANTQVVSGDYGSPSKTTTFTVDSKGRLQAAGESTILIDAISVISGIFSTSRMPAFSGDISTSAGNTVATLASTGVNAGDYTKVTVDEKGRVTGGTNPSTIGTYGIIDAYTKVEVDAAVASATPSFDTLTGKPNTIAGYGIIDAVSGTQLGVSIATLGNNSKVPPSQLPSYVDDIIEYPTVSNFPVTGTSGIIYIDSSTKASYRWSGSAYINVGQAGGAVTVNFTDVLGKPTTLSGYGILDAVNSALVGADSGLATLGPNGKLTTSQMPAAVDQIQEIGTFVDLPVNGLTSVIYLVLDTNQIYRFSGSAYVEISSAGTADAALKLYTARTISMTGDVEWSSGVFDGSANATGVASLKTSGVTAGTYTKVSVNAKGIVTSATTPTTLAALGITDGVITSDIGVNVAPLVSGKVPSVNLPSYVDDVLEFASLAAFPNLGEAGKIYIAIDTNLSYRWATSVYVQISSAGGVVSVAALNITTNGNDVSSTVLNGTTAPVITLNLPTANSTSRGALSATDWTIFNNKQAALVSGTTIKTINGASVLGSGDIVVASSYTLPPATPTTLGGVKVDGTTITVDGAGKITAVGGGSGGTGAFASFSIVDGELVVEHSSSFTLSIVDGEFISEYN
jgi:phage-related tail fiber protein